MSNHDHSTLTLDDEDGGRFHLAWSRSGRTLGVSVSDRNFASSVKLACDWIRSSG
jgi:hypothetical protein